MRERRNLIMKDREIKCTHYEYEGHCDLGHEGTFRKACQHCKQYNAVRGAEPARRDLRKQKKEKALRKEFDF